MCGIDALAFINAPVGQESVTGADFIAWADRYIHLDGILTGRELYSARCGLVHTYGVESRMTREDGVRQIGYFTRDGKPHDVRFDPTISDTLVMVSVEGLIEAFFRGIDRSLTEVFGDPLRRPVAEQRLRTRVHELAQGYHSVASSADRTTQ